MDLQKKSIFGTEPAAFGGTCFFFAIPISYLFYATQHAPGGNKLWKSAARVCSRLQHWLEICNSVWVKLVDCHGLHKATDPCNFRYVLRVISMYLSTDQFWANSFDPYSAFRKASYIILHHEPLIFEFIIHLCLCVCKCVCVEHIFKGSLENYLSFLSMCVSSLKYMCLTSRATALVQGDRIFGYPKDNWLQTSKKYRHVWKIT